MVASSRAHAALLVVSFGTLGAKGQEGDREAEVIQITVSGRSSKSTMKCVWGGAEGRWNVVEERKFSTIKGSGIAKLSLFDFRLLAAELAANAMTFKRLTNKNPGKDYVAISIGVTGQKDGDHVYEFVGQVDDFQNLGEKLKRFPHFYNSVFRSLTKQFEFRYLFQTNDEKGAEFQRPRSQ